MLACEMMNLANHPNENCESDVYAMGSSGLRYQSWPTRAFLRLSVARVRVFLGLN